MGKKSKHQGPIKLTGARDIGDLFLRTAKALGVPAPKENGDSNSAFSEEQALDELDEFPDTGTPQMRTMSYPPQKEILRRYSETSAQCSRRTSL
ncbi:Hypothetical predicted protein [Pelobates cultripes]|uniref:Uncharacterized protein n=1 Tax=Pelobates cultripes TaxID=61616 RepID=A0AAD1R4H2_PELCU|nr:Hypothetical predicted protein [Pelobates cultripes]